MKLRITIDIFSGRNNPVVELSERDSQRAIDQLTPARALSGAEARVAENPLGYRGLIVEQSGAASRKLPRRFRLVNGKLLGPDLAHLASDVTFEDLVCKSTALVKGIKPQDTFLRYLARERARSRRVDAAFQYKKIPWPVVKKCPCAPIYEPAWWNDGGTRQFNNNCYNYASNYRTDTFAQPGLAAGAMYTALACPEVRTAAMADELIVTKLKKITCPKVGHLVALVVAPGWDFHWYRLGPNMLWSHKPGGTPVTNLDNSGHAIADPRTADRGPYTQFCGFMIVMHGHIKIA